ncbi:ECF transporter S component [Planococcus lenghuensis]|uniref:ECF transporter S component n=1 Tax=Planococcus lenghuensis TaxID=2213202 RepID=A0A1Q2L1H5_9BACL|nr:ECF transporter S component [Planococcus lenghuensis]AQQ54308.1 ECF transporter S component [Planococcus lenghuensis]
MNIRTLTAAAMFMSLSAVGGMLKLPVGPSSIAFDSFPALVAVLFLSAPVAGIVGAGGHLLSALYGGMPLGPFHFLIAAEMFIVVFGFAKLNEIGIPGLKWLFFVLGNGIIAAVPFYFLLSPAFFFAAVPGLLLAAAGNALAAGLVLPVLLNRKSRDKTCGMH